MKSSQIRDKFLKYFENNGHTILPGSSLVPKDPTVLLTLAGMLQFKPIFLGKEKARHKRAATVQKCIRTIDIERVGKTSRHHTFFEMLGNFSFGDYFKKDAIRFAWELLTKEFKLPEDKLHIAVFEKDDEAYAIWKDQEHIDEKRIHCLGEDNNFWAAGPTGPCGPCSEIYYDHGTGTGCGKATCAPGCDCDRFLEIWNLVFIQYDRNEKSELVPLKQKSIDTGMGLERIAAVMQGVDSNFKTDLFMPIMELIEKLPKNKSIPTPEALVLDLAKKVIADHVRAATHLISDGVMPSNEGRGYVLRRLIRRAVVYGRLYGLQLPFTQAVALEVISQMAGFYKNLLDKQAIIINTLTQEEKHFMATLEQGLAIFKEIVEKNKGKKQIPGEAVFKLHDTYGFPIEITKELAEENGLNVDEKGFNNKMQEQKDRARQAGIASEKQELLGLDLSHFKPTNFEGYDKFELETKILAVYLEHKFVVLEKTPFYPEQGGQAGDIGLLQQGDRLYRVLDTLKNDKGVIVHKLDKVEGLKEGTKVRAEIDANKRHATNLHHTATHLLHKALQQVLGEQVKQAGSYVGPDKLRFDFNHFNAMTESEKIAVEKLVNAKIKAGLKVEVLEKAYDEAIKMGAMALFDEKYGDRVRVLKIGDFSLELCGGTHAKACADILFFKILHESALGSGIRRIEALAGEAARQHIVNIAQKMREDVHEAIRKYNMLQMIIESLGGEKFSETNIFEIEITEIDRLAKAVDEQDLENVNKLMDHLKGRVQWLKERIAKAEKEVATLREKNAGQEAMALADTALELNGKKLVLKAFNEYSVEMLRVMADSIKNKLKSCVILLTTTINNKVRFLSVVSDDLVAQGISAKKIADKFCAVAGGKGGGRENKVEGGAEDPGKVEQGFEAVKCGF